MSDALHSPDANATTRPRDAMPVAGPPAEPVIGIVGSAGAYGVWLRRFFEQRMRLRVLGHDPADPGSDLPGQLVEQADVLLFAAPIRHTPELIAQYVAQSGGRERGRLWLDITSLKQAPVAAMLRSQAEVVGLHPMTAPLKTPTLKGRVVVVCEERLDAWRLWLQQLLDALQGEYVRTTPAHHDRVMALVQAMVHAAHLGQAGVLRGFAGELGGPEALLPYRSIAFEMDAAVIARILSLNPEIYEDIQLATRTRARCWRGLAPRSRACRRWWHAATKPRAPNSASISSPPTARSGARPRPRAATPSSASATCSPISPRPGG